ncbi:MAG: TetR/AcrR family transcriptional regulator [Frankiaceae bacterium]|nr:TetR/AcrR family transcriptional regulator [Frankiaceae bacterium]
MSEAAVRPRSARGKGAELRGEVLRAAMDLLTETGEEDAVSLRAVAQRVGVSVPSIYLHFADKQALLDAVCEEVFEALHAQMRAAAADAQDCFDGLRRQGIAYVQFAVANPEHYRIVLMRKHAASGGDHADLVMASSSFREFVASVQDCVDAGVFEGDAEALALRLWAAAHGVAALLVAKPYFPWPPLEDYIEQTIRMAGMGIALSSRLDECGEIALPDLVAKLNALRD